MSSDPERPIEKLLRACGKERRDRSGESWELHSANRRLLQQAVAEKFNQKKNGNREATFGWLLGLSWMKVLGGTAVLTILAIAFWLAIPSRAPQENVTLLARNEPVPRSHEADTTSRGLKSKAIPDRLSAADEREVARQPETLHNVVTQKEEAPDKARVESADKDVALSLAPGQAQQRTEGSPPETPTLREKASTFAAAPPASAPAVTDASATAFRQRYGLSSGPTPAAEPPASIVQGGPVGGLGKQNASAPQPVGAGALSDLARLQAAPDRLAGPTLVSGLNVPSNQVVQWGYFAEAQTSGLQRRSFQQAQQRDSADYSVKLNSDARVRAQVLAYFRLEQAGPELRVIDSDDSVYAGPIELAIPTPAPSAVNSQRPKTVETFRAAQAQTETAKSSMPLASQIAGPKYLFQVVGTNRTSKQRVMFSGSLTGFGSAGAPWQTPAGATTESVAGRSLSSSTQHSETRLGLIEQNIHVSGTVTVGSAKGVDIEALPAPAQTPQR